MGESHNAHLMYGFDLGHPDEREDFPGWLLGDGGDADDEDDGLSPEDRFGEMILAHYAPPEIRDSDDYKVKSDFVDKFPYEVVSHCHHNYRMYFIGVRGTKRTALRGDPTRLDEGLMAPAFLDDVAFFKFCEKHGIPWPQEGAAWTLFSEVC